MIPFMRPASLFPLFAPIESLRGVGDRLAPILQRHVGRRVRDLVLLRPSAILVRSETRIADLVEGEVVILTVRIINHLPPRRPRQPWRIQIADETGQMDLLFFKGYGAHLTERHPLGAIRVISGKVERNGGEWRIAHPDYILPGARRTEIALKEPVYPATAGLTSRNLARLVRQALEAAPQLAEWQDTAWISRQGWPSWRIAIARLHTPDGPEAITPQAPERRRLAYDELLAHQLALGERRGIQKRVPAPAIPRSSLADRIVSALPFPLTRAQVEARESISRDLESGERMTRLLQGDVGSGKTLVALLAIADSVAAGRQAALMAPTEILARQHFETLAAPLAAHGVRSALFTGRLRGAAREAQVAALRSGEIKVAIGTHALFQDDIVFDGLALTVIDEQHRFGVSDRVRLQGKGEGVHLLAMSATPIPRTLELTLYGDLDVSRLYEKPPGRRPIVTRASPMSRLGEIESRLSGAVKRGEQAFWICPLVAESEKVDLAAAAARYAALERRLGDRVGLIHGRLPNSEKDDVMGRFVSGQIAVLVATTVVEVGVNVPAATIMIIEQAERFGLAQLHQLRGRVGRGARPSSCVLLHASPLGEAARRRLEVLRRTEDGFEIAELDLELRGGGDPLGLAQSGFPDYRLADPIAHRDLILAAADDARLILARDPHLETPRGEALRTLRALFDWRGGSIERAD